ncbi:MAG: single-stranded DNA-binding protein [Actinobacteria bacterium]|jgi:single-strand DNA-binding protein|nr:single-stranded DNA-binding protein [Actinomycetota bacterium]
MAGETAITVVGNLTADPEMRYTGSGVPFASFTIASTPRTFDRQTNEWKDGEALFLRATVWREFAEHVANSLTKGMRVIARGNLRQRSYDDKDGQRRTSYELDVDEIGPSLRYATAQVTRSQSRGQGGGFGGGQPSGQSDWGRPAGQSNDNPWGNSGSSNNSGGSSQGGGFGSGFDDEQPF